MCHFIPILKFLKLLALMTVPPQEEKKNELNKSKMPFAPNNQAEKVQNGVRLFVSLWSCHV